MPFADEKGIGVLLEHARSLSSGPTELVAPLLPTLALPAAVIWGAQDPFLKLEFGSSAVYAGLAAFPLAAR